MKGEFYPMEYDAWDEGTISLTLEQEAAYLRLCHQMYRRRGSIPNNEKLLCVLWRVHPNKARPLLKSLIEAGKIVVTPEGHLTNTRVTDELHHRDTLRTHRAHAGHTGGIRSGHVRRNPLKTLDVDEAKRSTLQDTTRQDTTLQDKKALSPPPTQLTLVPEAPRAAPLASEFNVFWGMYPRKEAKRAAEKAYVAARKRADFEGIMAGLKRAIMRPKWQTEPDYIPHPTTWLNGNRWLDQDKVEPEKKYIPI